MKLKVDDIVRLKTGKYPVSESNPAYKDTGVEGRVFKNYGNRIYVTWDNGQHNSYAVSDLMKVDESIIDVDDLFKDIDI